MQIEVAKGSVLMGGPHMLDCILQYGTPPLKFATEIIFIPNYLFNLVFH